MSKWAMLCGMRSTLPGRPAGGLTISCQPMSNPRQPTPRTAEPEFLLRTLAMRYPTGAVLERHRHDWAQLVYASEGVMRVETDDGLWVVPSHRAVWIPAGVAHSIAMSGWVSMRTLYLVPELAGELPSRCCVVSVSPLLRELILHAIAQGALRSDVPAQRRLVEVLL